MNVSNLRGKELFDVIQANRELRILRLRGFLKGDEIGKTMNVDLDTVLSSLGKQEDDVLEAFYSCGIEQQKKALADLINVAGCVFLKVIELEEKVKKKNE